MKNKKNLGIIGLVVLSLIAAVLIYRDTRTSKLEITENASDTLKNLGIEMTGEGKVEVVPIDDTKLPPAPSLSRVETPLSTIAPEVVKAVQIQMANTIENLKKDSKSQDNWITLGGERKNLGDYVGARDAWEYAKVLNPTNIVPWNNLGDLYHFYLKNYVKSEENWKKTISLKPEYIQGYRGLYELYTYSMKEKSSEIPAMLKQGIAKNPSSADLKALLADYEKTLIK